MYAHGAQRAYFQASPRAQRLRLAVQPVSGGRRIDGGSGLSVEREKGASLALHGGEPCGIHHLGVLRCGFHVEPSFRAFALC
jgi:hypothetical protein